MTVARGMTRRRRIVLTLISMAIPIVVVAIALFAVDLYLHGKYEKTGGYNIWGYRGPRVPSKRPGEFRAVMLGGSTAYGWGVSWYEAIPAVLEQQLNGRSGMPRVSVVNLAYNNQGAHSFRHTLEDYLWMDYDLVVLYEGYNDILNDDTKPNVFEFRRESMVFRLTGYMPIFPDIFREKASSLLTGSADVAGFFRDKKTVFRPSLAARGTAGTLNAIVGVGNALERQLALVASRETSPTEVDEETGCRFPWPSYCRAVLAGAEFALEHGKPVVVVGQPHFPTGHARRERHISQQRELAALIARRYQNDPRVQYVDMGDGVDLDNPELTTDGMHLTLTGNTLVARALAEPVAAMAARRTAR